MESLLQNLLSNISTTITHEAFYNATSYLNTTGGNYTNYDQSIEDILLQALGPRRSPFFLPVALGYLLIFLTGLSGNVLTCVVIAKHKKMRNPTNLYLLSLAVSDLLVLLFGMPLEVYELWQNYPFPFGEAGCYFKTFLFEVVCFASILNVMALSVERYLAVVHPLKTRYLSTNRHAKRVIGGVWLASAVCAVPNTSLHGIFHLPGWREQSAVCSVVKPVWVYNLVIHLTTVFFYFVPMAVISVLYLVMGVHLRRESRQPWTSLGKSCCSSSTRFKMRVEHRRRRQITKMLSIVVAVFGVCWAPFHVSRLLWSSVSQWTDLTHAVYEGVHILSGVLFYLSSAVNPIIYNLLSTRFRECFQELVCSSRGPRGHRGAKSKPPPFPKIILDHSGHHQGATGRGSEGKDSNAFAPLLSPTVSLSLDSTATLTCSCKEEAADPITSSL